MPAPRSSIASRRWSWPRSKPSTRSCASTRRAETGGVNASVLHWDLICDLRAGGRLSADGHLVSERGTLVE
jgi:hypothetical protein